MTATLPSQRTGGPSRPPPGSSAVAIGVVVVLAGIVAGRTAAGTDPDETVRLVGVAIVGIGVLVAIALRPAIAALVTLVLVAIFPVDTLFRYDVSFSSGGLKVTDLLLLACLGSWIAHHILDPRPFRLPSRATSVLVLAYVAFGFVGVLTARSNGVELKFALLELRAVVALLLLFPIVDGVRRLRELEWALVIFLVACAVSSVVITRDFLLGRGTAALFSGDATRINNLVYLYPMIGLVWAFALMPWIRDRRRWLLYALAGICASALFFTSRRGGWVVVLLAPVVVLSLVPPDRRRGFLRVLAGVVVAGVLVIGAANELSSNPISSPLSSARDRLFSVGESDADVSARYRVAELDRARELIADAPLAGVGLGGSITFVSPLYNPTVKLADVETTSTYLHDSYVFVALKMGMVAFVMFLLLLAVVTLDAYAGYRSVRAPREQRLMLGGLVTIVALIGISLTEPHLTFVGSSPLFMAAIALTQVVPRLARDEASDAG